MDGEGLGRFGRQDLGFGWPGQATPLQNKTATSFRCWVPSEGAGLFWVFGGVGGFQEEGVERGAVIEMAVGDDGGDFFGVVDVG